MFFNKKKKELINLKLLSKSLEENIANRFLLDGILCELLKGSKNNSFIWIKENSAKIVNKVDGTTFFIMINKHSIKAILTYQNGHGYKELNISFDNEITIVEKIDIDDYFNDNGFKSKSKTTEKYNKNQLYYLNEEYYESKTRGNNSQFFSSSSETFIDKSGLAINRKSTNGKKEDFIPKTIYTEYSKYLVYFNQYYNNHNCFLSREISEEEFNSLISSFQSEDALLSQKTF